MKKFVNNSMTYCVFWMLLVVVWAGAGVSNRPQIQLFNGETATSDEIIDLRDRLESEGSLVRFKGKIFPDLMKKTLCKDGVFLWSPVKVPGLLGWNYSSPFTSSMNLLGASKSIVDGAPKEYINTPGVHVFYENAFDDPYLTYDPDGTESV